jgi:hypothetical protein
MVPQRPFFIGRPGWVRSSTCIWLVAAAVVFSIDENDDKL